MFLLPKSSRYLVSTLSSRQDYDTNVERFSYQVKPLSDTEVITEVDKAIRGPNSTTAELITSGNQQKAALTSYFTLTATEGTGISLEERDSVVEYLYQ